MIKNKTRSRVLYWEFFSEMGKKYNLDTRIVEAICLSPFKFTKDNIRSEEDLKPIMLHYLGKFKLKERFKENKNRAWKD